MRGLESEFAVDVCIANVVGNIDQHLVWIGPFGRADVVS